jgi:hypothetical protein
MELLLGVDDELLLIVEPAAISSDGLQSSYPYLDTSTSLGVTVLYSVRLGLSPYSYLALSSVVDVEVADAADASDRVDDKSTRGLFLFDEEALFVLRALKRNFIFVLIFDIGRCFG